MDIYRGSSEEKLLDRITGYKLTNRSFHIMVDRVIEDGEINWYELFHLPLFINHTYWDLSDLSSRIDIPHLLRAGVGTNLTYLNLSYNEIDAVILSKLARDLYYVPHLTHLILHHNQIGPKGALELAHRFKIMPQLEYLDVHSNDLGPQGIEAILENLDYLPSLRYLHLNKYPVNFSDRSVLSFILLHASDFPFYPLLEAWMKYTGTLDLNVFRHLLKRTPSYARFI